jgi:CDP-diacylglycerol--serine O-phosphatidyltransferase
MQNDMQDDMVDNNEGAASPLPKGKNKGIYMLPNLVTLAALFGGFYAIVMAMNDRFGLAVIGIFCAMVLDGLDGRVARMTNTQSAFGEQMDSLSDMVSFGVAPALVAYAWALKDVGRWGWMAAFVYCACAALRLARFNVNTAVVDKRYFQGLPSPAAAALLTGFIWIMIEWDISPEDTRAVCWFVFALALYAGLTMVSNVPFYSFKDIGFRKSVPFAAVILIVLIYALITIDPATVLFGIFALYGVSGYAVYGWRRLKGQRVSVISTSIDEPEESGLHPDRER